MNNRIEMSAANYITFAMYFKHLVTLLSALNKFRVDLLIEVRRRWVPPYPSRACYLLCEGMSGMVQMGGMGCIMQTAPSTDSTSLGPNGQDYASAMV